MATIERVEVVHRAERDDAATEQVITVADGPLQFQLLEGLLDEGPRLLGAFDVPPGFVMQVRAIASDVTIALRGEELAVFAPSGEQSGVKVVPGDEDGSFPAIEDVTTEVEITLDPFDALLRNSGVGFLLKPTHRGFLPDRDGDGFNLAQGDCDDDDPARSPGVIDVCDDGSDQDCDGEDDICIPADPAALVGPIDPTVVTQLAATASYLFDGANPVQRDVAPGAIDLATAALLRGAVADADGAPLAGVTVAVVDRSDLGFTRTRADGAFDLGVPGDTAVRLRFSRAGHIGAERILFARPGDVVNIASLVLTRRASLLGFVDLCTPPPMQMVGGSEGAPTLFVGAATQASAVMLDGSEIFLGGLAIHATTIPLRDDRASLPAALPSSHEPIMLVDFSVDEAEALGATAVRFDPPLPVVVPNVAGLPVGVDIYVGRSHEDAGGWTAAPNARVVRLLDIDAAGRAQLDITGGGNAADDSALAALGIGDDERLALASAYPSGAELMRAALPGFSLVAFALPGVTTAPLPPLSLPVLRAGDTCEVGEMVGHSEVVADTPFSLTYSSSRAEGRTGAFELDVPLLGADVPASLTRVDVAVDVAGRKLDAQLAPAPNLQHTVVWDGRDAFGRLVQGTQRFTVEVTYRASGVYQRVATGQQFGDPGIGEPLATPTVAQLALTVTEAPLDRGIGLWDARRAHALGGFVLDAQHTANPLVHQLTLGDGTSVGTGDVTRRISTLLGTGIAGFSGDGGPAASAVVNRPRFMDVTADGAMVFSDSLNGRVRRVDENGVISTIAGGGSPADGLGDGGPALLARIDRPEGVVVGPDGSVYIAESARHRVRRVAPDGTISTFAGTGTALLSGDGGLAAEAQIDGPKGLAMGVDGSLFIADHLNAAVRRVDPAGIITTIAGGGDSVEDGVAATESQIKLPFDIAVDVYGRLYVSELHRVRRIDTDGLVRTVAGTGEPGVTLIGAQANQTALESPSGVLPLDDGGFYAASLAWNQVYFVDANGTISLLAGRRHFGLAGTSGLGDGGPSEDAELMVPVDLELAMDGSLLIAESLGNCIRRVELPLPSIGQATAVALANGDTATFDADGRHMQTRDPNGALTMFGYDPDGLLATVSATDGVTEVIRDGAGVAKAIRSPAGTETSLVVDTAGDLTRVERPDGTGSAFFWQAGGLLTSIRGLSSGLRTFIYDGLGCATPVGLCGNHVLDPGEQCDDGGFNSDGLADSCRLECLSPRCGDGVIDSAELCDDGPLAGAGACNSLCTAYEPATLRPFVASDLVAAPPGSIGVLMSQRVFEPLCFLDPPDFDWYDDTWRWLDGHDFVVGMVVQLAEDMEIPNAIALYDGGPSYSRESRTIRVPTGNTEPLLGPVEGLTGDLIAIHMRAGSMGQCECSSGGSSRFEFCSESLPGGGSGPCPGGPSGQCVGITFTDTLTHNGDIPTYPSGPDSVDVACGFQCALRGTIGSCDPDDTQGPPLEGLPDTCSLAPGRTDPICGQVAGFDGSINNCTCHGEICEGLGMNIGSGVGRDECMFQRSSEDGDCYAPLEQFEALGDLELIAKLSHARPIDAWAFCTSVAGRERCRQVIAGEQPGVPKQANTGPDDTLFSCSSLSTTNVSRCLMCADRNGGACLLAAEGDRAAFLERVAEDIGDPFNMSPDANDTENRSGALAESNWRTNPSPVGGYNPKQPGNMAADPVSLPTGELSMSATDVSFPSRGVPFELTRFYRSGGDWYGTLGPGWTHSYEELIEPIGYLFNVRGAPTYCTSHSVIIGCLLRHRADGSSELYVYDHGSNSYVPQPGSFGVMRVLTNREGFSGYELFEPGGVVHRYDLSGVLLSVKDAEGFGVDLDWDLRDEDTAMRDGCRLSQKSHSLFDRFLSREESALSQSVLASIHQLCRMELESVTDSYGRVFEFQYGSRMGHAPEEITRHGPYNHQVLERVRYGDETLVSYEFLEFEKTDEAFLTRVVRTGMSGTMPAATPIITEYDYQHAVISEGGTLAPGGELREAVADKVGDAGDNLVACMGAISVPFPNMEGWCSVAQVVEGTSGGTSIDLWPVIEEMIADNIIRVRRGGSGHEDIELESFFDPDPSSADFDRVVKQRYGADPGPLVNEDEVDIFHGTSLPVFTWQTSMPEARFYQQPAGERPPATVPSHAAETDIANPDLRNRFNDLSATQAVPDQVLAAAPLVGHDAAEDTGDVLESCLKLDATLELPFFHPRPPVGARQDQDFAATPTLKRTAHTCTEIAGRHSRDAFLNDLQDTESIDHGLYQKRRIALAWDAALVCRWVQLRDRRGSFSTYGINFMGQVVVEAHPHPGGGGHVAITTRLFNADGLIERERRPDGSSVEVSYDGQTATPGNTLFRELPVMVKEVASSAGAVVDVVDGPEMPVSDRTTSFTYEPLFQQLSTMTSPDGTVTRLFYDYQQMHALDPPAQALLRENERSTGRRLLFGPFFNPFLNKDLDGDGATGVESSSQLVLSVVEDVEAGEGDVDVGQRITRDDCGTATDTYQVSDAFNDALDTDRVHFIYYEDLADSEAGADAAEECRCAEGPLAITRRYRTPNATAAADLDEVKVAYDKLGGVRHSVANDDDETLVTTLRNGVGLIVEESRPNNLHLAYEYDSRGQIRDEVAEDLVTGDLLSQVEYAWGNQGVPLGSCRHLAADGCTDFQAFALDVVRSGRTPLPTPAPRASSSYVVPLLDLEDLDIGFVDAAGGRTDRIRNESGAVTREIVRAAPSVDLVTDFVYDAMGRPTREAHGGLVERFMRYDGFGRLTDTQANAPLALSFFTSGIGTIASARYDLLDRVTTSFVVGDDGNGARRFLRMTRTVRNDLGAPRFVHTLAQATLPASAPALPGAGITAGNAWATEELRYDHALRVVSHLPEGRSVPTSATYDGFGVATIHARTQTVDVSVTPRSRTRTTTHTLVGEDGGQARAYARTEHWDGAGNSTDTSTVDFDNGVPRASKNEYDALGRLRTSIDATERRVSLTYDDGGRMVVRKELLGATTYRSTGVDYDAMSRVEREIPEGAPETEHLYDLAGRRIETSSGSSAGAFVTDWTFDEAGRVAARETTRGTHASRRIEWLYGPNRGAPSKLHVAGTTAKEWKRDGLDRPVLALDENVADGTPAFNTSRPTLTTRLTYDAMGRVLEDQTSGTFPTTSPTLPGAFAAPLSHLAWTQPLSFLGPTSVATMNREEIAYRYTGRGTLSGIERSGATGTRTIKAKLASAGGLWTSALITPGNVTVTKTRDAFGFVTESSLSTEDEMVFQEDVLRGPTGRVTAQRRTSSLFDSRAAGYRYDPLQRLTEFSVDTSTAMTRGAFFAQTSAALGLEDAGFFAVASADATVSLSSTKADVLTGASVDHEGRGFFATGDPTAAGVPQTEVNAQSIERDNRDRVSTDGELEYTWDVFDRLVLVMRGGVEEMRIAYDGLGRRRLERRLVTRPAGDVIEDAVLEYAGGNVIEESAVGGAEIFLTITHAPGLDTPLVVGVGATAAATKTWTIGTTARGDAASAIDVDALVVDEEALLDTWGEREVVRGASAVCIEGAEAAIGGVGVSRADGVCASKSEVLQRFGLAGARLHARTKLVDLRNRVYATHMRAFLTKDPLGNVDSEGLWNYTAGDPINLRDPWGLATQTDDPAPDDNDDDDDDGLSRGPDYGGDNWPVPRDPDSPIKYPGDGEKGDKPWNFTVFGDCDDKCERDEAKRFLGDLAPNEKEQRINDRMLRDEPSIAGDYDECRATNCRPDLDGEFVVGAFAGPVARVAGAGARALPTLFGSLFAREAGAGVGAWPAGRAFFNTNWKSVISFGHTFKTHGAGPKITKNLFGRAAGTGQGQGQWVDNEAAAQFLAAQRPYVQGITEVFLPPGLGQLILPSGEIVPAIAARLAPSASGGYISAFPIP